MSIRALSIAALCSVAGCASSFATGAAERSADPPGYSGGDPLADDDETGDDDAAGDDDGAPVELLSVIPEPGATDHLYRAPIVLTFSGPAPWATALVFGADGYSIATDASWNQDGTQLTLRPNPWLAPDAEYSVQLEFTSAMQAWTFRTSSIGRLDVDLGSLDGRVYAFDLAAAEWVSPAAAGPSLDGLSVRPAILLAPSFSDGLAFDAAVGRDDGESVVQDACLETGWFGLDGTAYPLTGSWWGGSGRLVLQVGGAAIALDAARIDADFAPDGESIVEGSVSGWLPETSVSALFGTGADCGTLAALDAECVPCPDSAGECLFVDVRRLVGVAQPDPLQPVGPAEQDACDNPPPVVACAHGGVVRGHSVLLAAGLLAFAGRWRRASGSSARRPGEGWP